MMKSLFYLTFLGLTSFLGVNFLCSQVSKGNIFLDNAYLVIPSNNMNKDFGIVASVSEPEPPRTYENHEEGEAPGQSWGAGRLRVWVETPAGESPET